MVKKITADRSFDDLKKKQKKSAVKTATLSRLKHAKKEGPSALAAQKIREKNHKKNKINY